MQSQSIIRVQKNSDNPFVMIDKRIFSDNRISWKAKGILGYLLSKPDDWKVIVGDLVKQSKDGEKSVYSGLRELIDSGYLVRQACRENGKIVSWEYIVFETPQIENREKEPANPCDTTSLPFCTSRKSTSRKGSTTNIDYTNTDITEKEYNENGLSAVAEKTSHPNYDSSLRRLSKETKYWIKRYLIEYRDRFGEKHPNLVAEQRRRVEDVLESFVNEYFLTEEDIDRIVIRHFERELNTDYNINHFATEGIIQNLLYDLDLY